MSSGAFARASGLSRKALRLYDELGLLAPARVDPVSQYRFYEPAQLEQARLVAWLRRLGMPLAAIRAVSTLPPSRAAAELAAYWAGVEAETAARRELAAFLVGYLSGRDMPMSDAHGTVAVRCAVQSDIGLQRTDNEDAAPTLAQWPSSGCRRTAPPPAPGNCWPSTTNGDRGSRSCWNDLLMPTWPGTWPRH